GGELVGGVGDGEAGERTRQGDVFDRLLRRPVLTERDAAVAAHEVHVELHVGAADPQLLIAFAEKERGEARGKRDHATGGQAGGNGAHVGLGDADVEEPLLELLSEQPGVGGFGEIGVENDDARILFAQLGQRAAVGLTGGAAELERRRPAANHRAPAEISASALAMSSGLSGTEPWNLSWFSM